MAPDLRNVVGSVVTCKATHITNLAECSRRYGSNAKTKILEGTVAELIVDRSNATSCAQTYVVGDWELGNGRTKRVKVHIWFTFLKESAPPVVPIDNAVLIAATDASSGEDNNNDIVTNNNNNDDNTQNNIVATFIRNLPVDVSRWVCS